MSLHRNSFYLVIRYVPIIILLCFFSSVSFALKEYYALSRSIRSLGMGGAFYGLSDDESAIFYNPASLSLYRGGAQFMVSTHAQLAHDAFSSFSQIKNAADGGSVESIVSQLESLQGKPLYSAVNVMPYFIARGFAFGILAGEPKVNAALLGAGIDSSLDVTAISDHGVFLSFAGSLFHPSLHFGVTTKALARAGGHKVFSPLDMLNSSELKLEDLGGAGGGIDFDLGATYEFSRQGAHLGGVSLVLSHLLASEFTIGRIKGNPPGLVRSASLGVYYQWNPSGSMVDYVRWLIDLAEIGVGGNSNPDTGARTGAIGKHVNLGVEMPLWGRVFLRTGVHQGNWTAGLGFSLYALKLDLATYAEELGAGVGRFSNRRWALRLAFGFGAPSASESPRPSKGRRSS